MADICVKASASQAALDPDVVLRSAAGVFDRLVVVGYDKDGKFEAFGSLNFSNEDIVFVMERLKHKIMAGDYGRPEDRE